MIYTLPNGTIYDSDLKFQYQDLAFQKYANEIMSLKSCLVENESIKHILGTNKNGEVSVYTKKVSCDNYIKITEIKLYNSSYDYIISQGINIEILNS